jgi:aryl-phospho-beta-D-glucosidase BglC (GH1 family)
MIIDEVKFAPAAPGDKKSFSFEASDYDWGKTLPQMKLDLDGEIIEMTGVETRDIKWLEALVEPWVALMESGCGVMAGEWGVYNKTPHGVALRWMEDYLKVFKEAGLGWALWNFEGAFGILNSGRDDVDYEQYNGKLLDREMLELLQKY